MKLAATTQTTRPDGHRTYQHPNGNEYPSVTTILAAGLPNEFTNVTVRETIKSIRTQPDQPDDWHKQAHTRFLNDRGELGTQVHAYAEAKAKGEPAPEFAELEHPDYQKRLAAVDRFFDDYQPTPLYVEAVVYNREHGYAGTGDLVANIPGHGVGFIDYKTSAGVYEKHQLQAVAYLNATEIVVDGHIRPMPRIDFAAVILFAENGQYRLEQIPARPADFATFLAAKVTAEWRWNRPKPIPLQPTEPLASRTDVLERRCRLLQDHGRIDALSAAWPSGVPTFRKARDAGRTLSSNELAAIGVAVSAAEAAAPLRASAYEAVGPRLKELPADLLGRLDVTLHDVPSIQDPGFTGAHHAALDHYLGVAETVAAERQAEMAAAVGAAGTVADLPDNAVMVGWIAATGPIDRLTDDEHGLLCGVLDAIADGYLTVTDGALAVTIDNPDELIGLAGGKASALDAARSVARRLGLKSPRSSGDALTSPLLVAAIAAATA